VPPGTRVGWAIPAVRSGAKVRKSTVWPMPPLMTPRVELLAPGAAGDESLVERLATLINEAYAVGEAGLWLDDTARTSPTEVARLVGAGELLVAWSGERVSGCARVRLLHPGTGEVGFISAAADARGNGVGRALLARAEDEMRARGAATMQLELLVPRAGVHPEKARLREWYTRRGYRLVRTAPFEEVATHAAADLATACEFEIFQKPL
jgi:GNAT superfamily N-acetyltransferase